MKIRLVLLTDIRPPVLLPAECYSLNVAIKFSEGGFDFSFCTPVA